MLRECTKYESLTKLILYSQDFWKFFKFVESSNFDIASDAFLSVKVYFILLLYLKYIYYIYRNY